ncbi:MAG: maleylpyruvate isomerase family mycothiol-dependent enzyme [Acidimicrobiales bacterium]|nr:maleylpyruvate isomerase family mycothiol-dependent enzyme [Acidimicrobiales bacterium]
MSEPVVDLLAEEWDALAGLGASLPGHAWDLPTDCPGWTVRDQYAHVIGTERMLLGEQPPGPPIEAPHVKNPIGAVNEAWVEGVRGLSGDAVVAQLRHVTGLRLEELRSMPAERFDQLGPSPVGEAPYREFMSVRVMDCWVHEQDVRRAAAVPGHLTGPVVALAVGRFVRGLPMVVGKRAGAPDGTTVVVDVTGPEARTVAVGVVDGRARLLDDAPAEPTAVLALDTEAFCCLMTGRWGAGRLRAEGRVAVRGDEELAGRVLDGANIMI